MEGADSTAASPDIAAQFSHHGLSMMGVIKEDAIQSVLGIFAAEQSPAFFPGGEIRRGNGQGSFRDQYTQHLLQEKIVGQGQMFQNLIAKNEIETFRSERQPIA